MNHIAADNHLSEILNNGLKAVLPANFLPKAIETIAIPGEAKGFHLFGAGKAALSMAESMMDIKGSHIVSATVISNENREARYREIQAYSGTHPILNRENIMATRLMMERMSALDQSEHFLFLLSGGASALFEILNPKIALESYREMIHTLMREGIDIEALNSIRIVLSLIKGGRAARQIKADGAVLLVSDVITDNPELIASGPFYYPDKQHLTKSRAAELHQWWRLERWISRDDFLEIAGDLPLFSRKERPIPHRIVANNKMALKAASLKATLLGYQSKTYPRMLYGEAREAARLIGHQIRETQKTAAGLRKLCLIWGGETTVTVKGNGIGGRNQELLLCLIPILADHFSWQAAAIGSDGIDGVSDAAGAFFSSMDYKNLKINSTELQDYLRRNDSASFFQKYGRQIKTGPTGTNVGDLFIVLIEP
jgi:glycerate 2-kinase